MLVSSTKARREFGMPVPRLPLCELILTPCRFAEMEKADKNAISHRGRALQKLQAWFKGGNIA